jgi:chemotaxis protein methyltransferase CheR
LSQSDYDYFVELLRIRAGIELGPGKAYLLKSRLNDVAETSGLGDVDTLLAAVRRSPDAPVVWAAIEAMTTNETFFFRDGLPFDQLRGHVLPELHASRRDGTLRVWCAACSTGQEPYSVAMLVEEERHKHPRLNVDILGSDISARCLERARTGLYSQFEAQRGLSVQQLVRHCDPEGGFWRVKAPLRGAVRWLKQNLMEDFTGLGRFDIVFCRNVLIYFDRAARTRILEQIASILAPDGYLFLGAAETPMGLTNALTAVPGMYGLYRKTGARTIIAA